PDSDAGILKQNGTEGTPLLENNEGVIYRRGSNGELRWAMEGFITDKVSLLVEPLVLTGPDADRLELQKGYLKIGGGGLELEAGRDANWFGPGYRGALTLTNNAQNFDLIKLSSPEPVDVRWVKRFLGEVKYALLVSRFDETGSGATRRQPYFIGMKLAVKPAPWFEIGGNFVRQEGGPGFTGSSTLRDTIFGGGTTNHNNTIAGIDLRFRIPWLRNAELYGEYAGEDSAAFWPIVESYVAGFYIPRLTSAGADDLRFEFFYGSPMLYTDFKFPAGYTYNGMALGHSQGGSALEFFTRYSHWFSPRHNVALEYFHTDRGREGRVAGQETEQKNAWRGFWTLPLYGDTDMELMYGWERIDNFNLVGGARQTNQTLKVDVRYKY
ncbi:MAG: capsule assembly Wzi family protein, partial [Geobacteraceae bacterium]|nr:capsule assembly Wzi family protein [Geobacteraceae bacterium]